MMQIDRLIRAIEEKDNPTALGLDTRLEYLPPSCVREHPGQPANAVRDFNFALLDALKDIVPSVKVQAAYYELMGLAGLAGIPGGSGYISKTLIHESIVEYIELLEEKGLAAGPYRLAEWIFLISGGLTLAYMLKLFICLCVEKNRDAKRQRRRHRPAVPRASRGQAARAAQ